MKRFFASLLLFAMLLALMPFALAENSAAVSEAAEQEEELQVLEASSVQYANKGNSIEFSDLRKTLNRYNSSVIALSDAIDAMDVDMSEAVAAIGNISKLVAGVQANYQQTAQMAASAQQRADAAAAEAAAAEAGSVAAQAASAAAAAAAAEAAAYQSAAMGWQADATSLGAELKSMQSELANAETTIEMKKNTMTNQINQIVKGAESLYIGILTMENALGDIRRGIDTLKRVIALTEKQKEIGMASQYDVESVRYQYESAKGQLDAFEYQIKTSKVTLEGLLGMDLTGTVTLGELTMPTGSELSGVDYKKNLSKATSRNVDVQNAIEEENAGIGSSGAVRAAEDNFAYKFKLLCLDVPEKQRLLGAAQDTVSYQQRTFEIAAKKYEMGMLSREEYLSAQGELESARSAQHSAEIDLFSAYRTYVWATQYGIV